MHIVYQRGFDEATSRKRNKLAYVQLISDLEAKGFKVNYSTIEIHWLFGTLYIRPVPPKPSLVSCLHFPPPDWNSCLQNWGRYPLPVRIIYSMPETQRCGQRIDLYILLSLFYLRVYLFIFVSFCLAKLHYSDGNLHLNNCCLIIISFLISYFAFAIALSCDMQHIVHRMS